MVFLTGANGLIGSFIARKLVNENIPVRALRRKNSNLNLVADIASRIEWVEGDILDVNCIEKNIEGMQTIIHAAAVISYSKNKQSEMFKANVEGTANLVNAALNKGIHKFLYLSSIAALGRKKNNLIITEDSLWEESEGNSGYAKTKYLAELEVWRGIEEGLNAIIVNPSVVLGPGNWDNGSSKIFKYVWDENLFYSKGEMNFIDVRDVSEIVYKLLNTNIHSERYILSTGMMSYKDMLSKIATCFHKRIPPYKAGKILNEIALFIELGKKIFFNKEPLITREIVRNTEVDFVYKNDKIQKLLGHTHRSAEETIEWVCKEIIKVNVNK